MNGAIVTTNMVCTRCHGSGWIVRDPDIGTDMECPVCAGTGVFEDTDSDYEEQ